MRLWKYNRVTGYWRAVRDVTLETAQEWLTIWQRDEPGEVFTVSARRPSWRP